MSSDVTIPFGERRLGELVFKLTKSKDDLKLFTSVEVKENFVPGSVDLTQLKTLFHDIPFANLHVEVLAAIIEQLKPGTKLEPRRIAKGESPVTGRDGKLLLLVKPFKGDFRAGELERIDPKFVRAFDNIEVGTVVARIMPPTSGIPGRSFLDVTIPPDAGKEVSIEPDEKTIELRNESHFKSLVSKASGYLFHSGKKLAVEHTLSIRGDVSFQTGDLDFVGAIEVGGDIKKDFTISADGDITVRGGVTGGSAISRHGALRVFGGVIGDLSGGVRLGTSNSIGSSINVQRCQLSAKTLITALTLENVFVETGGDLIVEREIRKCSVLSRGAVRVPKGSIIGGEISAVCGVEALKLGNQAGSDLKVTLLSDIESSSEYLELKQKIRSHLHAEEALELHLGPLVDSPGALFRLSEPTRTKLKKILEEFKKVKISRSRLELELQTLINSATYNRALRVNVIGTLYPGVLISVGANVFKVDSELVGPKTIEFILPEQRFDVHELEAVQCEVIT